MTKSFLFDSPELEIVRLAFEKVWPEAAAYRGRWTITGYIGDYYPTLFIGFRAGRDSIAEPSQEPRQGKLDF
jgi:hypothetical protein